MTTEGNQPFNLASGNAHVVQGQNVHVDTITIPGDLHLKVRADATGAIAARADAQWQFLTRRRQQKDEQLRSSAPPVFASSGDTMAERVDTLFRRSFRRCAEDKGERERWEAAVTGYRRFHRDEIIGLCKASEVTVADEMAWLK